MQLFYYLIIIDIIVLSAGLKSFMGPHVAPKL